MGRLAVGMVAVQEVHLVKVEAVRAMFVVVSQSLKRR
jgi:hypothetical protein